MPVDASVPRSAPPPERSSRSCPSLPIQGEELLPTSSPCTRTRPDDQEERPSSSARPRPRPCPPQPEHRCPCPSPFSSVPPLHLSLTSRLFLRYPGRHVQVHGRPAAASSGSSAARTDHRRVPRPRGLFARIHPRRRLSPSWTTAPAPRFKFRAARALPNARDRPRIDPRSDLDRARPMLLDPPSRCSR